MKFVCAEASLELSYETLMSGISPDYGIVKRFASFVVPDDGSFSLICDADSFDGSG